MTKQTKTTKAKAKTIKTTAKPATEWPTYRPTDKAPVVPAQWPTYPSK